MTVTLDHHQIQTALKQFDIKEHDYYLLFDQNVYMVWYTTGAKALQLVTENSCISLDYKGEWHYYSELPSDHVVPTYACVKYILAVN